MARRRTKGEASLRQRPDGRWEGRLDLGWSDGRRRSRSFYGKTKAEAATKLRDAQGKLDRGLPIGDGRTTVGDLLTRWYGLQVQAGVKAPQTLAQYAWAVAHLDRGLGRIRLAELSADDVDDFLHARAEAGAARASMVKLRSILAMALDHAARRDLIARNVARLAVVPAGPARESRALTLEQVDALLRTASGDRFEAAYVTMLGLGLRPGEALGLTWDHVSFERGELRIVQAVKRGASRPELGSLKTAGSRRTLAAPSLVVDALRSHRGRQAAERLAAGPGWIDQGLVFTNGIGGLVDASKFNRAFSAVTQRAGLGHWHPHELRHSFVSLASHAGAREEDVADVVGHVTTRMTHRVYRHQVVPTITAGKLTMDAVFARSDAAIVGQIVGQRRPIDDEDADQPGLSAL